MLDNLHQERVLILDFGSQTTQLIARRVRESHVYCEIHPYTMTLEQIEDFQPKGIILSGGPSSVHDQNAPMADPRIFTRGLPLLGICYGMQLMAHQMGGAVEKANRREYGPADIDIDLPGDIFNGVPTEGARVWMSHGDRILQLPPGFVTMARSSNSPAAAMGDPDLAHTPCGKDILENFLFRICRCRPA
jgi:GMP synthase (glutamine-hydrolysing)